MFPSRPENRIGSVQASPLRVGAIRGRLDGLRVQRAEEPAAVGWGFGL